jgi:N-acetylglucosamine kinase-like BadF-type ATPase
MHMAVAGIDGGGTKTRCLVADRAGRILGEGFGGPSNYQAAGRETAAESLRTAVASALAAAGLTQQDLTSVCAGLAGVARPEDKPVAESMLAFLAPARVEIRSDAQIALVGALGGAPGVIVISGTGSIAMGMNEARQVIRAGGWGWLLGDEGSGFDIGRRAVAAALGALDGTGPQTSLGELICREWQLERLDQVVPKVYKDPAQARVSIAGLVPLVTKAADQGDAVAAEILALAGRELARLAAVVLERLALSPGRERLVAVTGGVAQGVSQVRAAMAAALPAGARLIDSLATPAEGAVAIALFAANEGGNGR